MVAMSHGIPLIVDAAKRDLSAVIEWGRQKMLEGAYDCAIQHFTAALDLKPGLMHALVSRGFCHLTLGDEDKARRDFAEVITKDAGFNRNIYVLIALCFKRQGDYHTAIRYLSRCILQFASFKPALIARGELGLKVRDYSKARMDFRQVLQEAPSHLIARRGLGDAIRGLGNFREAHRQYTRAIEDALAALEQRQHEAKRESDENREGSPPGDSEDSDERGRRESSAGASIEEVDCTDDATSPGGEGCSDEGISMQESGGGCGKVPDEGDVPEHMVNLQEDSMREPEEIQAFMTDVLLRRALLLRLMGDLAGAGADLLEVLQFDPRNGMALFWYAKILLEQNRHKEAPTFLQASIQYHEETHVHAHALLGALLLTYPDMECESALRHLKEAARLCPSSQSVRVTLWICSAALALHKAPRDCQGALGLLDKALGALATTANAETVAAAGTPRRGSMLKGVLTPRQHIAGSGVSAAACLSSNIQSKEETRWSATRQLVQRRQQLAQGEDVELAMECSTYLQLVARDPQQQAAPVPVLLYVLRTVALCELGRWEDAVTDCRKALLIDPKDEATQYTMHIAGGIVRCKVSEFEAAVGCFTKAVRLQPVSMEARIHRAFALACAARAYGNLGGAAHSTERANQLLTDAVQDLEAVEQQAQIAGNPVPPEAAHLRAACLCSLSHPEEAWEVLRSGDGAQLQSSRVSRGSWNSWTRGGDTLGQQRALEAEVLVLLGRHREAVDACTAVLEMNSSGLVEARLMRGCCWHELGESELAFQDYWEALIMAPERTDVHEASGDLFLAHRRFNEAIDSFSTAAKLRDSLVPRLAYKRALAQLALGHAGAALKDLNRALRQNPGIPVVVRARDGVAALQIVLEGDYRHAHVRLNMLIHSSAGLASAGIGAGSLPPLFLPHELLLYRGVCAVYMCEVAAALQDFGTALDLARNLAASEAQASSHQLSAANSSQHRGGTTELEPSNSVDSSGDARKRLLLPEEVASQSGLQRFECEVLYNMVLCHLLCQDYRAARAISEDLLRRSEALSSLGAPAQCLAWFLIGVCYLALGEAQDEAARQAFMRSYAHDPVYVDDFLRRHGHAHAPSPGMGPGGSPAAASSAPAPGSVGGGGRVGGPPAALPAQLRPIGGSPPPGAARASSAREVCDAAPEAICCLRKERARFSGWLPPCRIQVRDVVIWGRPSVGWPFVRPPELAAPTSLSRLDHLQQIEALPRASATNKQA